MEIDYPAWMQAFGSLIAVWAAIFVPRKIQANAEREQYRRRELRQSSARVALLPALHELHSALEDHISTGAKAWQLTDESDARFARLIPGFVEALRHAEGLGFIEQDVAAMLKSVFTGRNLIRQALQLHKSGRVILAQDTLKRADMGMPGTLTRVKKILSDLSVR